KLSYSEICYFFFQAEDGIRNFHVTGVQTCALPIFRHLMRTGEPISGRDLGEMGWVARNGFVNFKDQEIDEIRTFLREYNGLQKRSEERRVGKESRSC